MILVYAFALYYALACVVKIYDAIEDNRGRSHLARARAKQVTREARNPVQALPLPEPVPVEDLSWLYSHDDALLCLSRSLAAEFKYPLRGYKNVASASATFQSTPRRLQASRPVSPLSTERSEVPTVGEP